MTFCTGTLIFKSIPFYETAQALFCLWLIHPTYRVSIINRALYTFTPITLMIWLPSISCRFRLGYLLNEGFSNNDVFIKKLNSKNQARSLYKLSSSIFDLGLKLEIQPSFNSKSFYEKGTIIFYWFKPSLAKNRIPVIFAGVITPTRYLFAYHGPFISVDLLSFLQLHLLIHRPFIPVNIRVYMVIPPNITTVPFSALFASSSRHQSGDNSPSFYPEFSH